jgi:hypothetical protein
MAHNTRPLVIHAPTEDVLSSILSNLYRLTDRKDIPLILKAIYKFFVGLVGNEDISHVKR